MNRKNLKLCAHTSRKVWCREGNSWKSFGTALKSDHLRSSSSFKTSEFAKTTFDGKTPSAVCRHKKNSRSSSGASRQPDTFCGENFHSIFQFWFWVRGENNWGKKRNNIWENLFSLGIEKKVKKRTSRKIELEHK